MAMKSYISTKKIQAEPMTRGEYNEYRGWQIPENEDPNDDGYLIKRHDGYENWMTKETFESDYKEVNVTNTFGFEKALEQLKKGQKVARKSWNGKGMYLFLAHGEDLTSCLFGRSPKCNDSVCMKTAQETIIVGWLASQTDMLAEDWETVE